MMLPPDDPGQKLTDAILTMVGEQFADQPETLDLEPIFRGIMSAYLSVAVFSGGKDYARKMLQRMTDALDDPGMVDAIYRGVEGIKGGTA